MRRHKLFIDPAPKIGECGLNLLTIRAAAAQLGYAPKTVRKFIHSGQLRGVRIGREWRVDQDELALFVKRRTV